jgi:tRNA threonylcarbamoyladenosine biosynthesis protein TsaB
MIVLGFDTATPATVLGLMLADGTILQARDDPAGERRPGHATRLLPLADCLLAEAGLGWSDLERIAVGVGPGTFTGLRIGIATARGLAQSLAVELVGVSSLRALARGASARPLGRAQTGERSPAEHGASHSPGGVLSSQEAGVLAAIDARRGEVFVAGYFGEHELLEPQAVPPDRIEALLERAEIDAGSEQWVALGDGAERYRDAFERLGVEVPADGFEGHRILGSAICELATRSPSRALTGPRARGAEDMAVVPDYRRRPDAEVALEGASA